MTGLYLWLKAFHIVAIIAWMAGLLYLPRLYVYHAEAAPGSDTAKTFEIMERRLLRGIMNPAVVMTVVFGGLLLGTPGVVDWQRCAASGNANGDRARMRRLCRAARGRDARADHSHRRCADQALG